MNIELMEINSKIREQQRLIKRYIQFINYSLKCVEKGGPSEYIETHFQIARINAGNFKHSEKKIEQLKQQKKIVWKKINAKTSIKMGDKIKK